MIEHTETVDVVRVVVADDHRDVRDALRLLLEHEPETCIPGEAADAGQLLAGVGRWRPDLVLLDWELPGMAAEAVLGELRALCPRASIVALSGRPEARAASLAAGADAFVSKADPPERLVARMKDCVAGRCLGEPASRKLTRAAADPGRNPLRAAVVDSRNRD